MGPARDSYIFEIVFCHLSKDPTCDSVRFINILTDSKKKVHQIA